MPSTKRSETVKVRVIGGPLLTFTRSELGGLAAPLNLPIIKVKSSSGWTVFVWQRDDGEWYYEAQKPSFFASSTWYFGAQSHAKGGYRSGEKAWRGALQYLRY